jgi:hypothetical protein
MENRPIVSDKELNSTACLPTSEYPASENLHQQPL